MATSQDVAVAEIFESCKQELNAVGVSVGILKNDVTSFYGFGETQKGSGIIPDQDTYFEIGSVTKLFTAIAIVRMLEEDGRSIDTPIRFYLPKKLPTINRNGVELTFKHLLTHTSGLPYMPNNLGLSFYTNTAKGWREYDNDKLLSALTNARLAFVPFTDFAYSNTAFGTLGFILEMRYGKDYGRVIDELVLTPLGLDHTSAYMKETDTNNWATGYAFGGKETEYWKTLNALDGAGVLKSNASEMLKFAQANLNPGSSPIGETLVFCQQPYTSFVRETRYDKTVNCPGWFAYENKAVPNEHFRFHNGGTGGFNSELFINLKKGTALVILFNTDGDSHGRQVFISKLLKLISD